MLETKKLCTTSSGVKRNRKFDKPVHEPENINALSITSISFKPYKLPSKTTLFIAQAGSELS